MHLVVVYGFQGAEDGAEQLSFTNELFDAVMGELAVIGRGQPCVIAGDFNVEPTKIPCLLNWISAALWIDLQGSWALAAGVDPDDLQEGFGLSWWCWEGLRYWVSLGGYCSGRLLG